MDDDNISVSSLPSSISLEDVYTPKSDNSSLKSPIHKDVYNSSDSSYDDDTDKNIDNSENRYTSESSDKENKDTNTSGNSDKESKDTSRNSDQDSESKSSDKENKNGSSGEDEIAKKNKNKKFTWESLDERWNDILLSDNFVVKDCIPDGNCQFRSLEEALKKTTLKMSHKKLRILIANYILTISDARYKEILDTYLSEKQNNEFIGKWNPTKIKTRKQFINEIKKSGFNFQGDNLTLVLLSEVLKIDFLIFNADSHSILDINKSNKQIVILYYMRHGLSGHYNTVGLKNEKNIKTLFLKNNLDDEINNILDKNIFFKKHLEHIYSSSDNFTCKSVITQLQNIINISKTDIQLICKILAKIVNNNPTKNKKSKARSSKKSKTRSSKKSKTRSSKKSKTRSSKKSNIRSSKKYKARSSKKSKARSSKKSKVRSSIKSKARSSKKFKARSSIKSKARSSKKSKARSSKESKVRSSKKSKVRSSKKSKVHSSKKSKVRSSKKSKVRSSKKSKVRSSKKSKVHSSKESKVRSSKKSK